MEIYKRSDKDQLDPRDFRKLENFAAIFDLIIILSMSAVFLAALVLLVKRKDFQPLKSRCVSLIFVSTLGNFLFFSSMMYNKIL